MQASRTTLELIPAAGPGTGVEACSIPLVGEPVSEATAAGLAQVFKALGDPVRIRLVSLIGAHQGGEVCVCDLTTAFDLTQPTISHHLKVLRVRPGSSTPSAAAPGSTTVSCPPRSTASPRSCPAPSASEARA